MILCMTYPFVFSIKMQRNTNLYYELDFPVILHSWTDFPRLNYINNLITGHEQLVIIKIFWGVFAVPFNSRQFKPLLCQPKE